MKDLIEIAEQAQRDGDLEAALEVWKHLTQLQESEESYLRYGRLAQELERWQEAEHAYTRAIALNTQSAFALELMGSLWAARTDKEMDISLLTAKEWFLRSIDLEKNSRIYTLLGCAYAALEDVGGAEDAFKIALDLDSANEEAMCNLANLYEDTQPKKAIELLECAISIDPKYGWAHQILGRIYQSSDDYIHAEYHFRRCLEIDPLDYWATLYLANTLAVRRLDSDAQQLFEAAIAIQPKMEGGYDFYANFLESIEEHDKAAKIRERLKF